MNPGSRRISAIVVVGLLLVSGFAGDGAAAPSPAQRLDESGTASPLVDATRANTLVVDTSAAVGLTLRTDALDDRLATLAHRERLAASTPQNQTAVLALELGEIRAETDRLATRQADTLDQHAVRNVTTEQLLFELARIDAAAQRLDVRRDIAVSRLADLSAAGVDTRTLRADLMALQGPVRAQVAAIAVGAANASPVSFEVSRDSVVLGTYTGDQAVVERYHADYLDAPTDEPATIEGVTELIATRYPAEWENRTGYTIRRIDADLLYVEFEYTEGTIVAYVDRPTAQVFKEFHFGPRSADPERFGDDLPGG
jgi:hypothetical protein